MRHTRDILRGFIAFEGIDGTGTTTQLGRLSRRLEGLGAAFQASCEPTPGPAGRLIREALSGGFDARPETVARLFAADRGEHLYGPGGLVERASRGELVVSDRYLFSSLAYQGLTCGPELPAELNARFPLPELLLFFSLDPDEASRRLASRKALEIYENLEFQRRVDAAYRRVVASFEGSGMTIVRIDAAAGPDEVEAAVWDAVEPLAARSASRAN
jgi:dTMP kinase